MVTHYYGREKVSDRGQILLARIFIVAIVAMATLTPIPELSRPHTLLETRLNQIDKQIKQMKLESIHHLWPGLTSACHPMAQAS